MNARRPVVLVILLLLAVTAVATEWYDHPHGELGRGDWLTAVGEDCIGAGREDAETLLFFNARTCEWFEYDFDAEVEIQAIQAAGHLVLVVGADRAVVFNSLTSSMTESSFAGSLLPLGYSYDCGRDLAMVVTDEQMMVFDADLDAWQVHPYALTGSLTSFCKYQAHDTYAVAFIIMSTGDPLNLVYSLPQHAFNETAHGLHPVLPAMSYGYSGVRSIYLADGYVLGYSAATNTFDRVTIPYGVSTNVQHDFGDEVGPITVSVLSYEEQISDDVYEQHVYAFDTRHANWLQRTLTFDRTAASCFSGWRRGGQFCSAYSYVDVTTDLHHLYDGVSHELITVGLGLDHGAGVGSYNGGTVFVNRDETDAVGYDLLDRVPAPRSVTPETYPRHFNGQDFIFFNSDHADDERTILNWFHGPTGNWTNYTTGSIDSYGSGRPHVQVLSSDDPQREVVFYSSYLDAMQHFDVSTWSFVSVSSTDHYAIAQDSNGDRAIVFDAHRGSTYTVGFNVTTAGERSCMGSDTASGMAQAYCLNTGQWTSYSVPEDCSFYGAVDLVGCVRNAADNIFYACDGSDGSWARLDAEGLYRAIRVGERTIAVVTATQAYGLGTGGMTPVRLGSFTLSGLAGAVEARWETSGDEACEDFRLTARHQTTQPHAGWTVAVERDQAGRFHALDRNPALLVGGGFEYTLEEVDADGNWCIAASGAISLRPLPAAVLATICPNPCNPRTEIRYVLGRAQTIRLCVHDLLGRRVRVLQDGVMSAGEYRQEWDGCDDAGRTVASGVYLVRLEAEERVDSRKVVLTR